MFNWVDLALTIIGAIAGYLTRWIGPGPGS
jgi:hypothetical protein